MTRQSAPASLSFLLFAAALLLPLAPRPVRAQDPAPYTLHVYTNLIQVPTLVVTDELKQLPPIPLHDFNITLDGGSPFHPSRMHRQGDDPIDLAILLDASGDQNILLQRFGEALASLTPTYLHAQDHITLYALDCTLIRSFQYIPAGTVNLHTAVTAVLSAPTLHGTKNKSACAHQLHLWDAIVRISLDLSNDPGRRVLLVISDGIDAASTSKWEDTMQVLLNESITVFAFRDTFQFSNSFTASSLTATSRLGSQTTGKASSEDLFRELCLRNGGAVLATPQANMKHNLQNLITMLRNRYILEFPRANNSEPGLHNIAVTVPKSTAFIAIAGVIVPMPDAKLLSDPTTVPTTTPSPATFGNRRPLNPNPQPHP